MEFNKFIIKNEYLIQAMWGGNKIDNCCFKECSGYFNNDENRFGRQFIEYCYSVIFNIHRLPGFELGYANYRWTNINSNLDPMIIKDACNELQQLYEYTQKRLSGLNKKKLKLKRCIQYLEVNSLTHGDTGNTIKIKTNIVSSFTCDFNSYHTKDYIVKDVDVADVLMYDKWIDYPDNNCLFENIDTEHEFWIINKDIFGYMEINKEDVILSKEDLEIILVRNYGVHRTMINYQQSNNQLLLKDE